MKSRVPAMIVLTVVILLVAGLAPVSATRSLAPSLIRIAWQDGADLAKVEAVGVPVYAHLIADEGAYLLAGATLEQVNGLRHRGLAATVLDTDVTGASYYLVSFLAVPPCLDWTEYGRLLLDEGVWVLLRMASQDAERLAQIGAELQAVTFDPKPLRPVAVAGDFPTVVNPDPMIQVMIDQVEQTTVYSYTGDLSGEWPVVIDGSPYTITTRFTASGTPIEKATQFAYKHLENLGLDMEYHYWNSGSYSGRNVIGEYQGLTNPDDIFVIGAHLDSLSEDPYNNAPGADDNASGSVAVMVAADILTQYQWDCTLRFALWTGEEQGLRGSAVYAQRSFNANENIIGVLNLDMIAWDKLWGPDIDLHANQAWVPASMDLAQLFADVVDAYDLDLIPEIIPNGTTASDHASFWNYGYTAILGIEDYYPNHHDFNDYYHTTNDKLQYVDMPYYADFVKASVGTFAHMANCLIQPRHYYLPLVIRNAAESPLR